MKYSVICQIGLKLRFLWVEGLACASVSLRLLITVSRASLQSAAENCGNPLRAESARHDCLFAILLTHLLTSYNAGDLMN